MALKSQFVLVFLLSSSVLNSWRGLCLFFLIFHFPFCRSSVCVYLLSCPVVSYLFLALTGSGKRLLIADLAIPLLAPQGALQKICKKTHFKNLSANKNYFDGNSPCWSPWPSAAGAAAAAAVPSRSRQSRRPRPRRRLPRRRPRRRPSSVPPGWTSRRRRRRWPEKIGGHPKRNISKLYFKKIKT